MIKDAIKAIADLYEIPRCKATMIIENECDLFPGKLHSLRHYESPCSVGRKKYHRSYAEYEKHLKKVETFVQTVKQEIKRKRG